MGTAIGLVIAADDFLRPVQSVIEWWTSLQLGYQNYYRSWFLITIIRLARAGFLGPGRITLVVEWMGIAGRPDVHY